MVTARGRPSGMATTTMAAGSTAGRCCHQHTIKQGAAAESICILTQIPAGMLTCKTMWWSLSEQCFIIPHNTVFSRFKCGTCQKKHNQLKDCVHMHHVVIHQATACTVPDQLSAAPQPKALTDSVQEELDWTVLVNFPDGETAVDHTPLDLQQHSHCFSWWWKH